jgi:hypothetical protein
MKQMALNETSASRLCTTVLKQKIGILIHLPIEQESQ